MCFVESVVHRLTPAVMDHFSGHNVLPTLAVAVRIVSGVLMPPTAKFIDEFGRAYGFIFWSSLAILGLFIQAWAPSLATTIVAQLLVGIGWSCTNYVLTVVLADMTSLKNRSMSILALTCQMMIAISPPRSRTMPC